VSVQGSKRTPL